MTAVVGTSPVLDSRFLARALIVLATIIQIARIAGITAPHGELPFLSANDRSRWCAIAALTQEGVWEIDPYIDILDSKGRSKIWNTIDLVRHRGADGREHSYSSKPPLLTLMYAAVCKPITWVCGKTLTDEPFLIGRLVILFANLVPLVLWWFWLSGWLEKHVLDPWSRWMLLNAAVWGTFLTTFVATLNNHLQGAMFFTVSLALGWQILNATRIGQRSSWIAWFTVGVCAAMTVACELPALAWAAALAGLLLLADWKRLLIGFGLGSAIIAAAFVGTNYWAHGDWRPPYAHRGLGTPIGNLDGIEREAEPTVASVIDALDTSVYPITPEAQILPARLEGVLQVVDDSTKFRVALQRGEIGWTIYSWDDWYDYPKSYWLPENKRGVDRGEPNRWMYLLHFTIGHRGVLSLTPWWLWSIAGTAIWVAYGPRALDRGRIGESSDASRGLRSFLLSDRGIALALAAVTLVCIAFYTSRDVVDRNYAGVCSGFRWLFWLIPGWLWLSVPAVEWSARHRWARWALYIALAVSVFSATIPWPNPWTHPWPYRVLMWCYPENFQ